MSEPRFPEDRPRERGRAPAAYGHYAAGDYDSAFETPDSTQLMSGRASRRGPALDEPAHGGSAQRRSAEADSGRHAVPRRRGAGHRAAERAAPEPDEVDDSSSRRREGSGRRRASARTRIPEPRPAEPPAEATSRLGSSRAPEPRTTGPRTGRLPSVEPLAPESWAADSRTADSRTADPRTADPRTADPRTAAARYAAGAESRATGSWAAQSWATDPRTAGSRAGRSTGVDPDATQLRASFDPDATQLRAFDPDATQLRGVDPDATQLGVVDPYVTQLRGVDPRVAGSRVPPREFDTGESAARRPATARRREPVRADPAAVFGPTALVRDPVLHTDGLVKVHGQGSRSVVALDDVTMDIERGRFTAIMGASGSGKSTLLHCLAGLDSPTRGRVLLGTTDLTKVSERKLTRLRRDRIGFVFQSYDLLPQLSVRQNIVLPIEVAGAKLDPQWLDTVLEALELGGLLRQLPSQLSGGEQQRVAVARAVLSRPEVVLADEPTGALDAGTTREMVGFLRASVDHLGQTVVMVTHDPLAAQHTDRALMLHEGRLIGEVSEPSAHAVLDALAALADAPASAPERSDEPASRRSDRRARSRWPSLRRSARHA